MNETAYDHVGPLDLWRLDSNRARVAEREVIIARGGNQVRPITLFPSSASLFRCWWVYASFRDQVQSGISVRLFNYIDSLFSLEERHPDSWPTILGYHVLITGQRMAQIS